MLGVNPKAVVALEKGTAGTEIDLESNGRDVLWSDREIGMENGNKKPVLEPEGEHGLEAMGQ